MFLLKLFIDGQNTDVKVSYSPVNINQWNYGVLNGIPEAKRLMGAMSEVAPDEMIIYGTHRCPESAPAQTSQFGQHLLHPTPA